MYALRIKEPPPEPVQVISNLEDKIDKYSVFLFGHLVTILHEIDQGR